MPIAANNQTFSSTTKPDNDTLIPKVEEKEDQQKEIALGENLTVSTQNLIIEKATNDTSTENFIDNKKQKSPSKKKKNKKMKAQGKNIKNQRIIIFSIGQNTPMLSQKAMRDMARDAQREEDTNNMSDLIKDLKRGRKEEFFREKNRNSINRAYHK